MPSSPDNLDDESTQPIDSEQPQPVTHGQVHVPGHHPRHSELTKQLSEHLRQHVEHAATTAAYHGGQRLPGDAGESSQGAMSPGGASGSDYSTTSVGDTPDADSTGPTGY